MIKKILSIALTLTFCAGLLSVQAKSEEDVLYFMEGSQRVYNESRGELEFIGKDVVFDSEYVDACEIMRYIGGAAYVSEDVVRVEYEGKILVCDMNGTTLDGVDLGIDCSYVCYDGVGFVKAEALIEAGIPLCIDADMHMVAFGTSSINSQNAYKFGIYMAYDGNDDNLGFAFSPMKTFTGVSARIDEFKQYAGNVTIFLANGTYSGGDKIDSRFDGCTITRLGDGEVKIQSDITIPSGRFRKSTDSRIKTSAKGSVYEASVADILPSVDEMPTTTNQGVALPDY